MKLLALHILRLHDVIHTLLPAYYEQLQHTHTLQNCRHEMRMTSSQLPCWLTCCCNDEIQCRVGCASEGDDVVDTEVPEVRNESHGA